MICVFLARVVTPLEPLQLCDTIPTGQTRHGSEPFPNYSWDSAPVLKAVSPLIVMSHVTTRLGLRCNLALT